MKVSERAKGISPSLTRKLFNEAGRYSDVIDLTLGDPDFDTPQEIKDAAIRAICINKTHYSANAGMAEVRSAVAAHVKEKWPVDCEAEKNIALTVGGMEALYLTLLALVDPGDEVIILAPYYVNYMQMVQMCGGRPIVLNVYDSSAGLVIKKDALENVITDKTVAVVINSPNNPTGCIASRESLASLTEVAAAHDLSIISDEVYRTILFDGRKHESILQCETARGRTVLIDSASKEFSMTGWRIGYAYGPENVISNIVKLQENVAACATVPSQYALAEAYTKHVDTSYIAEEFEKRRDCLCDALRGVNKIKYVVPQGTFYLFADISECGLDSERFCYELLRNQHVAVVPGKAYGEEYDGYIRIAFTKDKETLLKAAKRLAKFISSI